IAIAAVVATLVVLAILQLRWLDEMARSEGDRLRVSAMGLAVQLERDFDRELGRAYFALQVSTHDDPAAGWPQFAAALAGCTRRAPYPRLIGEIYIVSAVGGPLRYARYDGARFVGADWPRDLAGLAGAVEREVRTPPPSPEVALWPRLPAIDAV